MINLHHRKPAILPPARSVVPVDPETHYTMTNFKTDVCTALLPLGIFFLSQATCVIFPKSTGSPRTYLASPSFGLFDSTWPKARNIQAAYRASKTLGITWSTWDGPF